MKIFRDLKALGPQPASHVAIGNFDGVHLGHQRLLRKVLEISRAGSGTAVAMTFDPHPLSILSPAGRPPLITTLEEKIHFIERIGIDVLLIIPFTREFSMLTGEEFVHDIVIQGVGARHVFVGTNFHFGRGGEGDVDLLKREGVKHGLKVGKVDVVLFDSRPISSTRIRDNIRKGNVERVAGMLGRHHTLSGRGVEGKHRGKALGFSTANLTTNSELIPRNGVYATRTEFAGTNHISVTNIGIRPTFDEKERVIETHILDYAGGPLYGRTIRVQFCTRLRDEIRFDSPEDLKKQIVDDVATTRSWFAENPLPR